MNESEPCQPDSFMWASFFLAWLYKHLSMVVTKKSHAKPSAWYDQCKHSVSFKANKQKVPSDSTIILLSVCLAKCIAIF